MQDAITTLLCFDYGEKRIGVAIGQTLTATASPLETIAVKNNKPDWKRIAQLLQQWEPQALVVGSPLQLDGNRQQMTDVTDKFSRQLYARFKLPVYHADERLTSYEARRRLKDTRNLDPVAAQIILESWLAEHQESKPDDATIRPTFNNTLKE